MSARILFVDDEFHVLTAIKRQLHRLAEVELARGGEDALDRLRIPNRFAVIVSDLRMPGVDGLRLLKQARTIAPDVVRILLTGQVDVQGAIAAINDAQVFRLLLKPCETPVLAKALTEAVELHRQRVTERDSLEKTNAGVVAMLAEILERCNPMAYERGVRLKAYAGHVATAMQLGDTALFEDAALLSQIGATSLPAPLQKKLASGGTLTVAEQTQVDLLPEVGARWLAHIPRLTPAAAMVSAQGSVTTRARLTDDVIGMGSRLLRVVTAYDELLATGMPAREVIERLELDPVTYFPPMVSALRNYRREANTAASWLVGSRDLKVGMILDEDVRARDGQLLGSRGQEITEPLLRRIGEVTRETGAIESIRVKVLADYNQVFGSSARV
jgi:response regulator RpfG family c-di-GMP phosphodiesterase